MTPFDVTADIAYGLRAPQSEAERIKHKYGCAMMAMVGEDAVMEVSSVGGRPARGVKRLSLCAVIEPRVEEIFMLVKQEIEKTGFEDTLASGAVITGGSTILEGDAGAGRRGARDTGAARGADGRGRAGRRGEDAVV